MSTWSSTAGHVGVPLPCNIVKLVDVEEMNYFASNGEGEVRLGSKDVTVYSRFPPFLMKGHRDPEYKST